MATFDTSEEALDYTQGIRKRLVDELTKDHLPVDKDSRITLLATLSDMDKQTLTMKKINTDDKNAGIDRKVSLLLAKYNASATRDQFAHSGDGGEIPDPNLDPLDAVAEGEMAIGISSENVQSFMEKFETE